MLLSQSICKLENFRSILFQSTQALSIVKIAQHENHLVSGRRILQLTNRCFACFDGLFIKTLLIEHN